MVQEVLVWLESECLRDMILLPSVLGTFYTPAMLTEIFFWEYSDFLLRFYSLFLNINTDWAEFHLSPHSPAKILCPFCLC